MPRAPAQKKPGTLVAAELLGSVPSRIALGESFDPTPANVEARLVRSRLANGMQVALLPRKTRGATVSAVVQLHFGDQQSLSGQAAAAH